MINFRRSEPKLNAEARKSLMENEVALVEEGRELLKKRYHAE